MFPAEPIRWLEWQRLCNSRGGPYRPRTERCRVLSRIAFLRIVGVIAVLTVGGVAGAKMRHHSEFVASDIHLAAALAPTDASATAAGPDVSGHAMFPLGVARGIPSFADSHASAAQTVAVDHLADLDQLRTAGPAAITFGPGANSRSGGSSAAFGHGFAGGGAAFGSIGMGGGRAPQSTSKKTSTPAAVTTKTPSAPAPAPRAPTPAPVAAVPPAVVPPAVTAPSLGTPVAGAVPPAVVAPPIFASQTTPIPAITGSTPNTDPAPLVGGIGGGGSVASKGPNLSGTPEPASLLLIATGLAVVIGASRRRQPKL
jgi:hypothetical protein